MGPGTRAELPLQGVARYISHKGSLEKWPMVVSEKGYALLLAAEGPVFCCDIAVHGPHLCAQGGEWLDYYFVLGKDGNEINPLVDKLVYLR